MGRYNTYRRNHTSLMDFKFFNEQQKLITDEELGKAVVRLEKQDRVYYINDKLFKEKRVVVFYKEEITIRQGNKSAKKKEVFIKVEQLQVGLDLGNREEFISNINEKCMKILCGCLFFNYSIDDFNSINTWRIEEKVKKAVFFDDGYQFIKYALMMGILKNDKIIFEAIEMKKCIDFLSKIIDTQIPNIELPLIKRVTNDDYVKRKFALILKVFEKELTIEGKTKRYRLAICINNIANFVNENDRYGDGFGIYMVDENSQNYNYFDEGRLFYSDVYSNENYRFFDLAINQKKDNELVYYVDYLDKMIDNADRLLANGNIVFSKAIYEFYKNRDNLITNEFSNKGSIIEQQLFDKYITMINEGKKVIFDGVEIEQGKISIPEFNFTMEFNDEFLDVKTNLERIKEIVKDMETTYNYNVLYEKLLKISKLGLICSGCFNSIDYKEIKKIGYKINGMRIALTKDDNGRAKINDVFCRIEDVQEVLKKAICYHDYNEFMKYIKDVSYIGTIWKNMICNGVNVTIHNPMFSDNAQNRNRGDTDNVIFRFGFLWDSVKRSHIYLVMNNQKYLLRYKGRFKYWFNKASLNLYLHEIKQALLESIGEITDDEILAIINNGIEEAKIIKKRGQELVRETIKDTKAKIIKIDLNNYGEVEGFYIEGIKGGKYIIDKENLNVFKWKDGKYDRRCVIDNSSKNRIFEDRLANRLVNIYNEFSKISTIQD